MADEISAFRDVLQSSKNLIDETYYCIENSSSFTLCTLLTDRIKETVTTLQQILFEYDFNQEIEDGLARLIEILETRCNILLNFSEQNSRQQLQATVALNFQCPTEVTGRQGRPAYIVSPEQIEGLRSLGFSWKQVASLLSISERTLRARREEFEIREKYTDIDDNQLDTLVEQLLLESPNMGEKLLSGALLAKGIHIQRRRMRQSVSRVDPVGKALRRFRRLRRRIYSVEGPNALW